MRAALILSALALAACSAEPPAEGPSRGTREIMARDAAIEIVSARLLDPESARFSDLEVREVEGVTVVCGRVAARNSLGGYAPPQTFVASGDAAFMASDVPAEEWREVWLRACGL